MTSLPEPDDFENEGVHGYDANVTTSDNLYTQEDSLDVETPDNSSSNDSTNEFENKEDHGFDNSVYVPDTVYEQKDEELKDYGGHRITGDEAEAYAIQLHKKMLQLQDRLSDRYPQMNAEVAELNEEFSEMLEEAVEDYDNGNSLRELSSEYVPELKSLRDQAEDSISFEVPKSSRDRTPAHAVQELQHFRTRWQGVIENHDRGSTDYTWDHRGTSDTVLQALRHIEEDLQRMNKVFRTLEDNVNMIDQIVYEFPEEVERRSENYDNELNPEELREYLGDRLEESEMDVSDFANPDETLE